MYIYAHLSRSPGCLGKPGDPCTYTPQPVPNLKRYRVLLKQGDTLEGITDNFGKNSATGWEQLRDANPGFPTQIRVFPDLNLKEVCVTAFYVGYKLKIPATWSDPKNWSDVVCDNPALVYDRTLGHCVPKAGTGPGIQHYAPVVRKAFASPSYTAPPAHAMYSFNASRR